MAETSPLDGQKVALVGELLKQGCPGDEVLGAYDFTRSVQFYRIGPLGAPRHRVYASKEVFDEDRQGIAPGSLAKVTGLTEDEITAYRGRLQRTGLIMVKPTNAITMEGRSPIPLRVYPMPILSHLMWLVGEE
jgi:hypothetical protein